MLRVLTDPAACARWAPIEFSTDQASDEYLHAGSRTRPQGQIAGRNVTFEVDYQLTPSVCGTLIEAQITLAQAGRLTGPLASHTTNALLGAGALCFALRAIAAEPEQLQQAGGHELASAQRPRAA